MRVACLFSGGKDSVFALFCCLFYGWEPILLTIKPAEYSTMFHHPNIKWCEKQAEAIGVPIKVIRAKGNSEADELMAIKKAVKEMKVDGIISGAIESEYQKERVDRIAYELGIRSFAPVWRTGKTLLEEQYAYLETYIAAVSAEGLTEKDLGTRFDREFAARAQKLKIPISAHLEGGEGETFVTYAPFFKKRLKIVKWKKSFDGARGVAEPESVLVL